MMHKLKHVQIVILAEPWQTNQLQADIAPLLPQAAHQIGLMDLGVLA
jgi:hypothetical protein